MGAGEDHFRFLGMGLPWFFMTATAVSCYPAFLFVKQNTENVLGTAGVSDPVAYRDRFIKTVAVLVACAANVVLCNFLFFSAGAQYAFFTALLTIVAAVSVFHPTRYMYSQQMALALVGWEAINSGAVLLTPGVLESIAKCNTVYGSYADVMCTDGWVSFSVFCAILVNGFSFLLCLLFIEIAISDSGRALELSRSEAQYAPIDNGYGSVESAPRGGSATSVKSAAALPPKTNTTGASNNEYAPTGGHYERIADDDE